MGGVTFVFAELFRKISKINNKKAWKKSCRKILPGRSYERNKKMGFPVCPDLSLHFHKKGQNHWILSSANTFALLYVDPPWPGWPACISCSTISWSDGGDSFCRIIWSDSLSWISWMSSRPASLFLKRSGSPLRKIDRMKIWFGGLVIHRHKQGKSADGRKKSGSGYCNSCWIFKLDLIFSCIIEN